MEYIIILIKESIIWIVSGIEIVVFHENNKERRKLSPKKKQKTIINISTIPKISKYLGNVQISLKMSGLFCGVVHSRFN